MNCLLDYIGILGCSDVTPDSGLFVNSLPGISLESIDKVANSEQVTYANVWNDVQKRAVARFKTSVISAFKTKSSDSYKISQINETYDLKKTIDANVTTLASAQYRGFQINLEPCCDEASINPKRVKSNLRIINIQSLSIYLVDASNDVVVNIIDYVTQEILLTKTIAAADITVDAWNLVKINESFTSTRLLAVYDAINIASVTQEWFGENAGRTVRGIVTVDLTNLTVTEGNDLFGLTGIFSIGCSYESVVCNNKSHFASAWWYILGEELMIQRLYSNRVNWVTNNKEEAKELKDFFSVQFENLLQTAIDGIDLNMNDECIECAEAYTIREARM